MPGAVFARGERVTLTTIHSEDYAFLERQFNDPATRKQAGASLPVTEADVAEFVEGSDDAVQFLVCRKGTPVGHVVLSEMDTQASNAELGWIVIVPEARGEGLGSEAAGLLLDHAFDDRGLHRVWAQVVEGNEASVRMLERLGFEREGVLREGEFVDGEFVDVVRYGLLAAER